MSAMQYVFRAGLAHRDGLRRVNRQLAVIELKFRCSSGVLSSRVKHFAPMIDDIDE